MRTLWPWLGILGTLALAGVPIPAGAQALGSEFQVNTYTTGRQAPGFFFIGGNVAADANGDFVIVWKSECLGVDAGDAAAAWLSDVLGEPLRLVRHDPAQPRHANPQYAPERTPVSFADAYPILMISRASLEELNRRLPAPIPMARFRPNVVIEGVAAHAEDAMTRFRLGAVVLRGVKHCTRCPITTTDQQTGARHPRQEPLRTLGTYRHDHVLKGVTFGQNCVIEAGIGERLAVGSPVTID